MTLGFVGMAPATFGFMAAAFKSQQQQQLCFDCFAGKKEAEVLATNSQAFEFLTKQIFCLKKEAGVNMLDTPN